MKSKGLAVGKALLWCLVMLLFPTLSGTLSVVLSLTAVETLFLQGAFMLLALIPPAAFVLRGRWRWEDIGFAPLNFVGCMPGRWAMYWGICFYICGWGYRRSCISVVSSPNI